MDEEIGRIKKSDTTEIVIKVDEFRGKRSKYQRIHNNRKIYRLYKARYKNYSR